jgi:Fuc2NAc and GlcNAc transferase
MIVLVTGAAALLISALLTGVIRYLARSYGLLDVPNERSSHTRVTPRGGGAAIVVSVTAAMLALVYMGRIDYKLLIAVLGGGIAVAAIGFIDDRRPIPARVRLIVHFGAAAWAVAWIGAPDVFHVGAVLAVLGIVWTLNLFNFMDGIDGIAASEAVFICCSAALLAFLGEFPTQLGTLGGVVGAACGGFLLWNWPPARIFMGDVGSGYLGYVLGVMGLFAVREDPQSLWIWLILGGVFFVDATVTLVRRFANGQRLAEAHRSHAYQWLARRWGNHKLVTVAVIAVNLLWLLPAALLVGVHREWAGWITAFSLLPLVGLAMISGAGRPEQSKLDAVDR